MDRRSRRQFPTASWSGRSGQVPRAQTPRFGVPGPSGQIPRAQAPRLAAPGPLGQAPWQQNPSFGGAGPSGQVGGQVAGQLPVQVTRLLTGKEKPCVDQFDYEFLNPMFNISRVISAGIFGTVLAAETKADGIQIAIKILNIGQKGATLSQAYREEMIIQRIKSSVPNENILFFYGVTSSPRNRKYITSELSPIGDLHNLMDQLDANGTKIWPIANENLSRYMIKGIGNGLKHLHSIGIAHGDLKPGNVLVFPQPGQWESTGIPEAGSHLPKLCDFSNSEMRKSTDLPDQIMQDHRRCTINFSAPESGVNAQQVYDMIKADVYSIGCNLLSVMIGTIPFVPQKDLLINAPKGSYPFICHGFKTNPKSAAPVFQTVMELKNQHKASDALIILLIKTLSVSPDRRPSLDQFLSDVWFDAQ